MLTSVILFGIGWSISTAFLFASLFILDDDPRGPFKTERKTLIWRKCAAITLLASLCTLAPFGGLVSLLIYLGGTIFLFQRSVGQAFGIMAINIGLLIATRWGLIWLAAKLAAKLASDGDSEEME